MQAGRGGRVALVARGLPLPAALGHPQGPVSPQGTEGDGERVGVRGSHRLGPASAGLHEGEDGVERDPRLLAERISLVAAPHPSPLPAKRGEGAGWRSWRAGSPFPPPLTVASV